MKYLTFFFLVGSLPLFAQELKFPQIKNFGGIYETPNAVQLTDTTTKYKIVVDITESANDETKDVNPGLEKVARLINLYKESGVPIENLTIVTVLHFKASPLILSDTSYEQVYHCPNPSTKILDELAKQGVQFLVCGQSIQARKLNQYTFHPSIKVTQGAILAITYFQSMGYAYLKL